MRFFLTHLYSDHVVDLFQLVISAWHQPGYLTAEPSLPMGHAASSNGCWPSGTQNSSNVSSEVLMESLFRATELELRVPLNSPPSIRTRRRVVLQRRTQHRLDVIARHHAPSHRPVSSGSSDGR
jgi:hypothetical protein